MYCIKMNNDKTLTPTVKTTIYQHEKNADTLVFLMPTTYDNINIADCNVYLRFFLPDGRYKTELLEVDPTLYKGYVRCHLNINTVFTSLPGDIKLWLCFVDEVNNTLLKSGKTHVSIIKAPDRMFDTDEDDVIYFNNHESMVADNNDDEIIYF